MRPLIKPSELARELGVSRAWIYEGARTGRIPSIRIGGHDGPLRFVSEDIEEWLNDARDAWQPGRRSASTAIREVMAGSQLRTADQGSRMQRRAP